MKKIDMEPFGEDQQIWFNIGRLRRVEEILKQPIGEILKNLSNLSLKSLIVLLMVGMRQHGTYNEQYYEDKIDKAMDAGYALGDIQYCVLKAIASSGIMGKVTYYQYFPEELTPSEDKEIEAEKTNRSGRPDVDGGMVPSSQGARVWLSAAQAVGI